MGQIAADRDQHRGDDTGIETEEEARYAGHECDEADDGAGIGNGDEMVMVMVLVVVVVGLVVMIMIVIVVVVVVARMVCMFGDQGHV